MTAVLALVLALQQTPIPAAQAPAPGGSTPAAPAAQAPPRRPAPATSTTTSTLRVLVTDHTGTPAQGVTVRAEGPVSREGETDASGQVQFRGVGNGTYRIRASGERFITLEKEVAVRAGAGTSPVEFALSTASAAPPPPSPAQQAPAPEPSPAPAPAGQAAKAGDSRVVSIADLAERSLNGREPIKLVPVGCSGLDNTQMIVLRETLTSPANPEVDQMLYVVAGEATLSLAGHDQTVTSGWFALVPRGMPHTLTRRGRNPVIVLSIVGGQSCGKQ